jgi:hypothetical protein
MKFSRLLYSYIYTVKLFGFCLLAGAVERAVQELPPPRGGAPGSGAPVAGLLPLPAWRPRGAPAAAPGGPPAPPVPGLHVGRPRALHAAPLPRRRAHARRLRKLARRPVSFPGPAKRPARGRLISPCRSRSARRSLLFTMCIFSLVLCISVLLQLTCGAESTEDYSNS